MKNIVETVHDLGTFKTLYKAVLETNLLDILSGNGPFTIFAPTDEAFSKLPDGIFDDLLKDKEELTELLTFHIIPEKIMVEHVKRLSTATTANGKHIVINNIDGVKINDARVIKKDIKCTNGVIHIIDSVLIPKKTIL